VHDAPARLSSRGDDPREVRVDILLGPDVFVNASVAPGTPPEAVAKRVLGKPGAKPKTTDWVLGRIEAILKAVPSFKHEMIEPQMTLIKNLVDVVKLPKEVGPDQWEKGLVESAKATGYKRVVTDHPDLADKTEVDGILFLSTDAWMVEQTTPPPPPPPGAKKK
jgi:hypothetical protein